MIRSMSSRSSTSWRRSACGELVELRAVAVEQPHRAAHRLVGEVLLLGVAQLARAVGDRAALGGQLDAR